MISVVKRIREEAMHEFLYAKAKVEVCDDIIAICGIDSAIENEPVEEAVEEKAEEPTEDNPMAFNITI